MADDVIAYSRAEHPALHRERVSLASLFFGLFASSIVWAGNLMICYGLAAHACYPGHDPLGYAIHGFGFAWPLTIACHVITLAVCVAAGAVSYVNWTTTGHETEGHIHHLMEKGEGRTRYLSLIGMCFSGLFFGATLISILIFAFEPLCAHG
jgi:hypothetical protein